ncbi:MAG: hypothetical protein M0011_02580 [Elusimicrobia bacterium]|nr:hypothetical protein [Elusimicrobiota bacterium]
MGYIIAVLLAAAQPAASAPPDVTALTRASGVMDECAGLADAIAALKAPAGLPRAQAEEYINELAGGDLMEVAPADAKFLDGALEKAGRLEDCGKRYRAALKESEPLLQKLQAGKLSEQDAGALGAAMEKYGASKEKLEAALDRLSLNAELQPFVSKALREYFLEEEGAAAGTLAASPKLRAAASGLDPQLTGQLKELLRKQKEQLRTKADRDKAESAKNQQALRELETRKKALAAPATNAQAAPAQPSPPENPLDRKDTSQVMEWLAQEVASARQPYCYRDSYGRGVGVPLSSCPPDKEKDAWLCYPKCKSGYDGVGPVCWRSCPSGYVDTGAFCHIDKPLTKGGKWVCSWKLFGKCMMKKLECPSGYVNAGLFCALKTPAVPPGWRGLSGLDIIKDSYGRGVGAPMDCAAGLEEDAALCYKPCKDGYHGVGPVCWMDCPKSKTECGAGCADGTVTCITNTAQMVVAPAMLAMNIASAGGTSGMTSYYPQIVKAFTLAKGGAALGIEAKENVDMWVNDYSRNFDKLTTPGIAARLHAACAGHAEAEEYLKKQYALVNLDMMLEKDVGETAKSTLAVASGFDPTGVSGVVSAYWQPVCTPPEAFPKVTFRR